MTLLQVFVNNGTSGDSVRLLMEGIRAAPGMQAMNLYQVNDLSDLFEECKQSLEGQSDCYAAVSFGVFNATDVDYSIILDSELEGNYAWGNWRKAEDVSTKSIFPLQWAIESNVVSLSRFLLSPPT